MTIASVFLYAWTGEMGYVGRWAFSALTIGAIANLLTFLAATLARAAGFPGLPARAAAMSILLNTPLSLLLVTRWGLTGAAIGTGMVMVISAWVLMHDAHRHFGKRLAATFGILAAFWPLLLICVVWGSVTCLLFNGWFASLEPGIRFARATCVYPGILAVVICAMRK